MSKIEISKLIRSKRKNIAFMITHDATLVVSAPMRTPLSYIEKLVEEKSIWIERKMREFKSRPRAVKKTFQEGEEFLYLGRKYQLRLVTNLNIKLGEKNELFFPRVFLWRAKARLLDWYREQALHEITCRVDMMAQKLNLNYLSIKISSAKRNWGSCGPRNSLNFNWRLIMAPSFIIDYVIIHELMHIVEKNHSPRFWNMVARVMPEYCEAREWLKNNSQLLTIL